MALMFYVVAADGFNYQTTSASQPVHSPNTHANTEVVA